MIDPELESEGTAAGASDTVVRQFAALCGAALGLAAARDIWFRGAVGRGESLAALSLVVVIAGLMRPGAFRPVFVAALTITRPIGAIVSIVLLGVMYYLIFTPLALVFRFVGRDALSRRKSAGVRSYWVAKERSLDVRSYFRQS